MRLRRLTMTALGVLTLATTLLAGPATNQAAADPTTLAEAQAQLEQLDQEEAQIGEQYDQVQAEIDQRGQQVSRLKADIAAQQAKVDALRSQAARVALTRYQSRGIDTTVQLVTSSDPESFLSEMATARKVDQNMNSLLQDFQAQQANLSDLSRSAAAELAALTGEQLRLTDLDAQLKDKVRQTQVLIDRLTEQERQQLNQGSVSRGSERSALVSENGDPRAVSAARYAVSKVPTGRYVWGASGPNAFDCSGLMLASYRSAGISLPHSSRAQSRLGRPISRDQLQTGDLLFFYSPIHHVGMYIGNGLFVHARNPRAGLEITRLDSYPEYQGARRILG